MNTSLIGVHSQSASGSGHLFDLTGNSPPVIYGCSINSTTKIDALLSLIRVTELHLTTFNLTISDPDGDEFSIGSNISSSPELSSVNISRQNNTEVLVMVPANELKKRE